MKDAELQQQAVIDVCRRIEQMRAGGTSDRFITAGLGSEGYHHNLIKQGFALADIVRESTEQTKRKDT